MRWAEPQLSLVSCQVQEKRYDVIILTARGWIFGAEKALVGGFSFVTLLTSGQKGLESASS